MQSAAPATQSSSATPRRNPIVVIQGVNLEFLSAAIDRALASDQLDTGHWLYIPPGTEAPRAVGIPWDPLVTIKSYPTCTHTLSCTLQVDGVDRPGVITADLVTERLVLTYE